MRILGLWSAGRWSGKGSTAHWSVACGAHVSAAIGTCQQLLDTAKRAEQQGLGRAATGMDTFHGPPPLRHAWVLANDFFCAGAFPYCLNGPLEHSVCTFCQTTRFICQRPVLKHFHEWHPCSLGQLLRLDPLNVSTAGAHLRTCDTAAGPNFSPHRESWKSPQPSRSTCSGLWSVAQAGISGYAWSGHARKYLSAQSGL